MRVGREEGGRRLWTVVWVWPRVSHPGTFSVVKVIRLPF